ncbi:MAG: hypothetical protein ACYC2H_06385 [Thermoplasmatota archaeon]
MSGADLVVQGWGWLRLAFGLFVFLLPGVAAADRWLVGVPRRWLWGPVLSFTVLPLTAILLNYGAGVPVTPAMTWLITLGLAVLIAKPRLVASSRFLVERWPRIREALR